MAEIPADGVEEMGGGATVATARAGASFATARAGTVRRAARALLRGLLARRAHLYETAGLTLPTLVVAPHPDDETLGCGGLIARKAAAGAQVRVVIMTDGASSHRRLMAPARLAALREEESAAAAAALGLPAHALVFLRFPDRRLGDHRAAAADAVRRLLAEARPREIFVTHRAEPPADHRAANLIVRKALAAAGLDARVYEYPVWLWRRWPWTRREPGDAWREDLAAASLLLRDLRCAAPLGETIAAKRRALAAHRSQSERRDGDPRWSTLGDVAGGEFLDCFFWRWELFHAQAAGPARAPHAREEP